MSGKPYVVLVHPRGTYKSTPFYFRGDDVLKEPEYLQKEKQDLENKLKQVNKELEKEKKIYDQTNEELKKRDEFTITLASALGSESDATTENAELRHQLAELTTKIEGTERAITKFKNQQQPPVITAYQKEKACYETEMEDLRIKIVDGINDMNNIKESMAKAVCSDEFATANIATGLLRAKKAYSVHLRKRLTKKVNEVNDISGTGLLKGPIPKLEPELETLVMRKHKLMTQKSALERETKRKIFVGKETALAMCEQLGRMNEILVALGGERIDINPLKEKYSSMDMTKPCDERILSEIQKSQNNSEETLNTESSEEKHEKNNDDESEISKSEENNKQSRLNSREIIHIPRDLEKIKPRSKESFSNVEESKETTNQEKSEENKDEIKTDDEKKESDKSNDLNSYKDKEEKESENVSEFVSEHSKEDKEQRENYNDHVNDDSDATQKMDSDDNLE